MNRLFRYLLPGLIAWALHAPLLSAGAAAASFTGTFFKDDDKRLFYFTLKQTGTVSIRTFSYAGGLNSTGVTVPQGGFDPTVSLFDSVGLLLGSNRDGGCPNVATDSLTSFCWDAFLTTTLPAGDYRVVLTQSENLPNGPNLSDSFVYDGFGNFTLSPAAATPGFWDFALSRRTAAYAVDIAGVNSAIVTSITSSGSLPSATQGVDYGIVTLTAQSGPGVVLAWSILSGALPPGLTLNPSTGTLSGIPSAAGSYSFRIAVTDGIQPVTQDASLTVAAASAGGGSSGGGSSAGGGGGGGGGGPLPSSAPPFSITTTALPDGIGGQPYGPFTLTAASGSPPYHWGAVDLPTGLSISDDGILSGVPTHVGSFSVEIDLGDSAQHLTAVTFPLIIESAPLHITTAGSLGTFVVNAPVDTNLSAAGGAPPYSWSSLDLSSGFTLSPSGGLKGTSASPGTISFTATASDAKGTIASSVFTISFTGAGQQPDLVLSQNAVSLDPTRSAASVAVGSSDVTRALTYSVAVSPSVTWLSVTSAATTPGVITIALNTSAAAIAPSANAYTANVTVTCAPANPCAGHTQAISVSYTVPVSPPALTLPAGVLSFFATLSGSPSSSTSPPLMLQNSGGGALAINSITTANAWLSVSKLPLTISGGSALPATITANAAGMAAGYYPTLLTVDTSAGLATIPATLFVAADRMMALTPSGAQFEMQAGGAPGNSRGSFSVGVFGNGVVNWTASVLPGAPWLRVAQSAGTSSGANPAAISYSLDPASVSALSAQTWYGTIRVASPDIANSPLDFQIVLAVHPVADAALLSLSTGGLLIVPGTSAQTVSVFSTSSSPAKYQASTVTDDGAHWLSVSPLAGSASSAAPGSSTISVNTSGLAPGVYRGGIGYASSGDAVRSVSVTLVIPAVRCTPTRLVPLLTSVPGNFALETTWPSAVLVKVVDDCGSPASGAQVGVSFSSGDSPLALNPIDPSAALYGGTWLPIHPAQQVVLAITATSSSSLAAGAASVNGQTLSNDAPALAPNGILHVFNPLLGAALSPGMIVQIYGSNLSSTTAAASTVPLPTTLADTAVFIGGLAAPLYYVSPGQINAQVPFELAPGNQYQVEVVSNGASAMAQPATLVTTAPGIAAFASGQVIAQHLDGSLVLESSPAQPGEYVVIYLAGLGPTDVPVATGMASPSSPLARLIETPIVTLDGKPVTVSFAGLTPSLVGLYQIDLQVPSTAPDGDLALILTQGGVTANRTILPVHR